jgi:hypothetical protein
MMLKKNDIFLKFEKLTQQRQRWFSDVKKTTKSWILGYTQNSIFNDLVSFESMQCIVDKVTANISANSP